MAKPTGPLFSLTASRDHAKTLTYRRARGRSIAQTYSFPSGTPSAAQASQRSLFTQAKDLWPLIGGANQTWWADGPFYRPLRTRWHRYLHHYLTYQLTYPLDFFQRPDSASTFGYAPTGHLWTGPTPTNYGITSNQAWVLANNHITLGAGRSNVRASVVFDIPDWSIIGDGIDMDLLFRWVDTANYLTIYRWNVNGAFFIARWVAGAGADIASWVPGPITPGPHTIGVYTNGTGISMSFDGIPRMAAIEPAHQAATRYGLKSNTAAKFFDDFQVEPI